jgi:hypothetical protein
VRRLIPLAIVALFLPSFVSALEPRFDHRDQSGFLLDVSASRATAASEGISRTTFRPMLRLAYAFDVTGEGDELAFGAVGRPYGWDMRGEWLGLLLDARFRKYFGPDVFKTFFELGLIGVVVPRLAVGPRVSLGAQWDWNRTWGTFVSASFATAFGQMRTAAFEGSAGIQIRWE